MLPQQLAAAWTIRSNTTWWPSSTGSRRASSRSVSASSSGSLTTGGSFGHGSRVHAVRRTLVSSPRDAADGCRPHPVTALGGRIRRRSVTRLPSSTRSKRTSSTRQQHSHSPQPRPLGRSVVDGGWGGLVGPWSTTVASTQASRTQTATWTGSPPRDPYRMALVAASSRASTSSSATWVGTSPSASRAARRRPASSNGEAEIVSSTQHPFRRQPPSGWCTLGSSLPRVGLTRARQRPQMVGIQPAVSSPADPLCPGEHPLAPAPG